MIAELAEGIRSECLGARPAPALPKGTSNDVPRPALVDLFNASNKV